MAEPEIVIVIEGGVITAVATKGSGVTYRVIDIDAIKSGETEKGGVLKEYTDYSPDVENADIEQYTKDILKDVSPWQ
ncbi:MAG: hypothetical protein OIN87_12060 [Candidatus Methanoperedens sp.]|nr:hypothetical protein [Candidatus Methanoperedens sp.]